MRVSMVDDVGIVAFRRAHLMPATLNGGPACSPIPSFVLMCMRGWHPASRRRRWRSWNTLWRKRLTKPASCSLSAATEPLDEHSAAPSPRQSKILSSSNDHCQTGLVPTNKSAPLYLRYESACSTYPGLRPGTSPALRWRASFTSTNCETCMARRRVNHATPISQPALLGLGCHRKARLMWPSSEPDARPLCRRLRASTS